MKKSHSNAVLVAVLIITISTLSSFTLQTLIKTKKETLTAKGVVILELFTSQGCSSCPPADKVLAVYAKANNPQIIPLAFHVDYWNYIGWSDPFSKAQYTKRQKDYAQALHTNNLYTPQAIVNGKYDVLGSNQTEMESRIIAELRNPAKADIAITETQLSNGKVIITYHTTAVTKNETVNIALVKKNEETYITKGENKGLHQTAYNIVYSLTTAMPTADNTNKVELDFQKNWKPSDFKIVAFVQSQKMGIIVGATQAELP